MWLSSIGFIILSIGALLFARGLFLLILSHYLHAYVDGRPTLFTSTFEILDKPKEQRIPPPEKIFQAGDILVRDFRDKDTKEQIQRRFDTKDAAKIKVVTLNMEMGKQISKVIEHLTRLDADIIFLQEVDLNTVRTGYIDTIGELAKVLKMNSIFTIELVMPPDETDQYLPKEIPYDSTIMGYEGNAILSKFDFVEVKGLAVPCARVDKHRRKMHNEAVVVCDIPNHGLVGCFCVHLDTYGSGVTGRVEQYFDILEGVKGQKHKYDEEQKKTGTPFYQIIAGDMNTLCHGLARCFPQTASDWFSALGRLGYCEAGYFQRQAVTAGNKKYGLNLKDPFDKTNDITFSSFKGLYQGKLDWMLMSENIETVNTQICPIDDKCSDHQWVMVEIRLC